MSRDGLVEAFWTHYRLSTSSDRADRLASGEWWWAREEVHGAVADRGSGVVALLVDLADAVAADADATAYLGAGPMEDLLRSAHGELTAALVDELDSAARRNPNFRAALGGVWWGDDDDSALRDRLMRFESHHE